MKKIRLLLLEDMIADAELILRTIEQSGMQFSIVLAQTSWEFINALDEQIFDVILADNTLPQFSANEALQIINKREIDIPFILVTGSISEEYAVEMMKRGTWDYILKDRLQRLPSAILNCHHKYKLSEDNSKFLKEVIANEALLKEASRLARFGSWENDIVLSRERWSDEQYSILDYEPGKIIPSAKYFLDRVHPEDFAVVKYALENGFEYGDRQKFECRIIRRDHTVGYISAEMKATRDENGSLLRINGFIQDISLAKESELKEKKITADLLQRNKDLEQFAYIVSHNLRGPVANIVGISQVLCDKNMVDEEKEDFMTALSTSVKNLDRTILDLNTIIQVRHHINENKEWVTFSDLTEQVIFGYGDVLQKKNISVEYDFAPVHGLHTLKTYLHSIFYNLISNSIKFRKKDTNSLIEIKSYYVDKKTILTFKDNGIGIDLEKKGQYMFGLYKRFHPEYAEGKGMGLFMVKTQVEALGGKISVQSKLNEGTTFTIEFEPVQ